MVYGLLDGRKIALNVYHSPFIAALTREFAHYKSEHKTDLISTSYRTSSSSSDRAHSGYKTQPHVQLDAILGMC